MTTNYEKKGKRKLIYDGNKCRRCDYNFYNAGIIQNYIWCFENIFSARALEEIIEAFKNILLIITSILLIPLSGIINYFMNRRRIVSEYEYLSKEEFDKKFNPKQQEAQE